MNTLKKKLTTRYTSITPGSLNDNQGHNQPLSQAPRKSGISGGQSGEARLADPTTRQQIKGFGYVEGLGIKNSSRSHACWDSCPAWLKKLMTLESITFASVLIFISMVFFYLFFPFEPVKLLNDPIPVVQDQVKAGEPVSLLIHFDKKMDIVPNIKYFLVDGFVLELSQASVSRAVGENTVVRDILIPESSTKGIRKIRIQLEYKINILRTVYYSWDSEEFEVI